MRLYIILLLLLLNKAAFSQPLYEFLKSENLPVYSLNQSMKLSDNAVLGVTGNYNAQIPITGNKLFNLMELSFDKNKELYHISLKNTKKGSLERNKQIIAEKISHFFSTPKHEIEESFEFFKYQKDGVYAAYTIADRTMPELTSVQFGLLNPVKINSNFDKFDQHTVLMPINYVDFYYGEHKNYYNIFFIATKETKSLYFGITTKGDDWKYIESIQMLFSDGQVFNSKLVTDRKSSGSLINMTSEAGVCTLPLEILSKLSESTETRIRINGRITDIIKLDPSVRIATQKLLEVLAK